MTKITVKVMRIIFPVTNDINEVTGHLETNMTSRVFSITDCHLNANYMLFLFFLLIKFLLK